MELTTVLAIYGAVTGTVAVYNNLKDRPWLRLRFRVVTARHGPVEPGLRHVIVELGNVGRRRALTYPPMIEYVTASWDSLVVRSPDEVWEDGIDWEPLPDTGAAPPLGKLEEQETQTYLYRLPPRAKLIRVRVMDSLGRRKAKYTWTGAVRLGAYRLARLARRRRLGSRPIGRPAQRGNAAAVGGHTGVGPDGAARK